MVTDPANYSWSSYRAHAFGQKAAMWKPHAEYLALGATAMSRTAVYRQFFAQQLSERIVMEIRDALKTGLALGNDRFKEHVEELTGVRQHHLKRGPRQANAGGSRG